ncbi:ABC transporter substrate-binding protein [Azoarcus communis]|uniref:Branched-chain amino acid ABC transporter substrate-binding protein n=1 Tax=Parazoarcus communis SWub3 = DSM 12120 TaxID=1121029 RepID=A0A323UQN6_9RHOO|nr:ABC transporter substrate-binding protein [Parazoarcus communis]NMG50841.1 ABC transporter substrate-binding protein [Parazoarcus communis]NMG72790.1 ABC transporter substrate-binding protein [Parazoarcus communis SWub3 = DSM 12120]PZA14333.1 branched-chain amino acid ABC transporter substrate-binding protein [Azoarcus communis] [Parazoarcus communis SWub3 = DSM 12120]
MKLKKLAVAVSVASLFSLPAWADINVGITVSATGPASALGAPQKNTLALLPTTIAGEKVNYILLDDATDPTQASKNAKKLVDENKVDVLIGSSTVSNSLAVTEIAVESKTPLLALAPMNLPPEKGHWVFRMPQHNGIMAGAIAEDMVANGVKSIGMIGFADPYGESFMAEMKKAAEEKGITIAITEKFNRADTSVMGQSVKIVAAKPDAVLIVASGTPSALPHSTLVERGFKGRIYQTHGAIGRDVLRVGGKALEGGIFVTGPIIVGDQLPDSHPLKASIKEYVTAYEGKYGAGSLGPQGGHLWDAYALIAAAVPAAKAKAQPGTAEFRAALRDAIEGSKDVVGVHGVFNMSPTDHFGHDERARVLVKVENGAYKLMTK